MPNPRAIGISLILAVLSLINISALFALEDDGFKEAGRIESKYFTISYAPQLSVFDLSGKLDISSSDRLLAGSQADRNHSSSEGLPSMIDTLFLRVADILDMHLYSFHGNIKVCSDISQLQKIYNNLFDKDLGNRFSFYVYSLNTIYISATSFKREILGHEIAHALICHYFAVSPSIKIQEVLAGYVEYQLRRAAQ